MLFQLSSNTTSKTGFTDVLKSIDKIPNPGDMLAIKQGDLNFKSISSAVGQANFFKYNGSLTTPPCSENLTFLLSTTQMAIDVDTYNAMKKVVKFNARYTQNGLGQANLLELSKAVSLPGEPQVSPIIPAGAAA